MTRLSKVIGAAALACVLSTPAQAAPIIGQTLIATGGDVVVTFVSNGAGYTSELYLDGPAGDDYGTLFNNWTTDVGTSFNLGAFESGTELVFRLEVMDTGDLFYTGSGTRNADGLAHASIDGSGTAVIAFEDVFGGGDRDYNDLVFSFTNVSGITDTGSGGTAPATTGIGASGGGGEPGLGSPGLASTPGSGSTPGLGSTPGSGGVAAVDEPATLMLLGSGLFAVVAAMKRPSIRR